jgi:hypothetical protein
MDGNDSDALKERYVEAIEKLARREEKDQRCFRCGRKGKVYASPVGKFPLCLQCSKKWHEMLLEQTLETLKFLEYP